jgi:hypothetical protein
LTKLTASQAGISAALAIDIILVHNCTSKGRLPSKAG